MNIFHKATIQSVLGGPISIDWADNIQTGPGSSTQLYLLLSQMYEEDIVVSGFEFYVRNINTKETPSLVLWVIYFFKYNRMFIFFHNSFYSSKLTNVNKCLSAVGCDTYISKTEDKFLIKQVISIDLSGANIGYNLVKIEQILVPPGSILALEITDMSLALAHPKNQRDLHIEAEAKDSQFKFQQLLTMAENNLDYIVAFRPQIERVYYNTSMNFFVNFTSPGLIELSANFDISGRHFYHTYSYNVIDSDSLPEESTSLPEESTLMFETTIADNLTYENISLTTMVSDLTTEVNKSSLGNQTTVPESEVE